MPHTERWIAAFDVDGTLAPPEEPPSPMAIAGLGRLAARGAHLVLASGKPCAYLAGFARAVGHTEASLIGENGAETWLRAKMPTKRLAREAPAEVREALARVRERLLARYGDALFFQPNAIGLTAFPHDPIACPPAGVAEAAGELPACLGSYVHVDSADFLMRGVDKGRALLRLAEELGVPRARIAAVGDGDNDLPMLAEAACGVFLGEPPATAEAHVVAAVDLAEAFALVEGFAAGL